MNPRRLRDAAPLAAVVAIAFAVRIAWDVYARWRPTINDDAGRYDFLARSLVDGLGYINPNGNPTMFWPPGWPFLLALIYRLSPERLVGDHQLQAALAVNAALGAATVALVYALARRAFDRTTALVAAALVALTPSLVIYAGTTLSETAFIAITLTGLWLWVEAEHRRDLLWTAAGALLIGYAALVRGQAALLPLVAVPFWFAATRDARAPALRAALALALTLAVVAPWTWRNYDESGSLVFISSNAGVDFYIGHSDGATGAGRKVDDLVFRYPELPPAEAEARVNRDGFRKGLSYAVRHPLRELTLSARKLWHLYARDDEAVGWADAHGERHVFGDGERLAWRALADVYYWLLLILAAIGAITTLRSTTSRQRVDTTGGPTRRPVPDDRRPTTDDRRPTQILLASLVVYWTLVHIAFFADPRFHAPILPVIAIAAAAGITTLLRQGANAPAPADPAPND
jgi:4-amino-4-deoxy-L-arabinose transferase-like glycosyltransferase